MRNQNELKQNNCWAIIALWIMAYFMHKLKRIKIDQTNQTNINDLPVYLYMFRLSIQKQKEITNTNHTIGVYRLKNANKAQVIRRSLRCVTH